jgi:hypothetical protein
MTSDTELDGSLMNFLGGGGEDVMGKRFAEFWVETTTGPTNDQDPGSCLAANNKELPC